MALVLYHKKLYHCNDLEFPLGKLIEGIWEQFTEEARSITRNRIYYHQSLTPLCEGMLKVAGKRATQISSDEYFQKIKTLSDSYSKVEIIRQKENFIKFPLPLPSKNLTENEAMTLAESLADLSKLKIGAVLLSSSGELISWGWNQHSYNKTCHAEIMLVKNYLSQFHQKIPNHSTLFTTLQPCAMCAGYLHGNCEDFNTLKIVFKNVDPGPKAQNSILVPGSQLWKNARSTFPLTIQQYKNI